MTNNRIYLDYNATTPVLECARLALVKALDLFANPSSIHASGRAAKALMSQARRDVAALVGAQSDWVIFTSGATEAAATLLTPHYFMGRSPLIMSHLYIGASEHPCILAGGRFAPENRTIIPVLPNGLIDQDRLDALLYCHDSSQGLPLVAIQYANHETGIIQPIAEIAAQVKQAGGLLIVDAVQAMGKEKVILAETAADFLIISAHKMGGVKGVGALIAAGPLIMPQPLLAGGGQERGHRSGTEALPLIAAFGAASAHMAQQGGEKQRLAALRQRLETALKHMARGRIVWRIPVSLPFQASRQISVPSPLILRGSPFQTVRPAHRGKWVPAPYCKRWGSKMTMAPSVSRWDLRQGQRILIILFTV